MVAAVVTGEYRRAKTALFLSVCCFVGASPHWLEPVQGLIPAIILAVVLGGYGLRVVLSASQTLVGFHNVNSIHDLDQELLPSVDILVAARD